jgi:uncharacterized protein
VKVVKWSISQLHKLQSKGLTIDEMVNVNDLESANNDIRKISLVHVVGHADIHSSEVIFQLTISGTMVLPCSRTLVDVEYPFCIHTTELFIEHDSEYKTDEDAHFVEAEMIDLLPIIQENILLEIPIQIYYTGEEKIEGAAPQSGNDWEVIHEKPNEKRIDPRLASLAKFFEEKE